MIRGHVRSFHDEMRLMSEVGTSRGFWVGLLQSRDVTMTLHCSHITSPNLAPNKPPTISITLTDLMILIKKF